MDKDTQNTSNRTAFDVVLSRIYLPILIQVAKKQQIITYGELVQTSKELHPDNDYVQRGIPTTAGRRLNVLREILTGHSLPDLSSLVVSASTGDVGEAYHLNQTQLKKERDQVYATDWDSHLGTIDDQWVKYPYEEIDFTEIKKKEPKPKPPSREELKKINSDYWKENHKLFPKWLRGKREEILDLLYQGYTVEECYKTVIERGE